MSGRKDDGGDLIEAILALAFVVVIVAVVGGLLYTGCTDSIDKRDCRRNGETVVSDRGSEWHCVGATPERR